MLGLLELKCQDQEHLNNNLCKKWFYEGMKMQVKGTLTKKTNKNFTGDQISSSLSSMLGMPSVTGNFLEVSGHTRSPLITSI